MKCPVCTQHSPPDWQTYQTRMATGLMESLRSGNPDNALDQVSVAWMRCSNEECQQLIIRVTERSVGFGGGGGPIVRGEEWLARPRFGETERAIDPRVENPYRRDYLEATALLEISPRMSAVLARRIVGDLLKDYAGKKQWKLTARIRSFIEEENHPSSLTTNLDHLREIADFGAHTQEVEQESETGEMETVIIDADREDAEWTLDLVDRLFDHLIVTPARDEEMKQKWDSNIKKTGRKELRPGEPEGDASECDARSMADDPTQSRRVLEIPVPKRRESWTLSARHSAQEVRRSPRRRASRVDAVVYFLLDFRAGGFGFASFRFFRHLPFLFRSRGCVPPPFSGTCGMRPALRSAMRLPPWSRAACSSKLLARLALSKVRRASDGSGTREPPG